jgi:hypothetical protein
VSQRTTILLVKGVLGLNYDTINGTDVQPFIDTASAIVDRVSTCAVAKGRALSLNELELIERWLAAHCYAMNDPTYQSKNTEGASATFQGQAGMHLEQTRFGQMAMDLDYSGCLTSISKRQLARGLWLGRYPSAQLPYNQKD